MNEKNTGNNQEKTKVKFSAEDKYLKCRKAVLKYCPWLEKLSGILENFGFSDMLMTRLIAVFFFVSGWNMDSMRSKSVYADSQWREFVQGIDMGKSILFMACGVIALTVIYRIVRKNSCSPIISLL